MEYKKHILHNGLRLITISMPAVSSATIMILVGAGSRYEEKRLNGITHFLEHMLFKGTKKRPKAKLLAEIIDSIGGEWNASTGKESTAYYIKAQASQLDQAFDILADLVTQPLLDPREIEREKGVVSAEIAMYEDTPTRRVSEIFETLLFPGSSLGWDISGEPQTIMGIKREDFESLYQKFYVPQNMVVVVAGAVDDKNAFALAQKYLGDNRGENTSQKTKESFLQQEPQVLLREKKTEQAHLVLGFRGNPRGHKDRWSEEILSAIQGGGMSSRLWIAVRERRGLAYYVRDEVEHYQDNGYLAISAGINPKKIDQAIKVILEEIDSLKRGKSFDKKELQKGKEFVKGHLSLMLEDTRNVAGFFGSFELLEDQIISPDKVREEIDRVTSDDVLRVAGEFFVPERLNLAVIGPYKDSEKFKKMLEL